MGPEYEAIATRAALGGREMIELTGFYFKRSFNEGRATTLNRAKKRRSLAT
jgi:hypothetical protein